MDDLYVIACATVIEELRPHLPANTPVRELEFGLHQSPDRLRERLQVEIDRAPAGHTILLGYGLCGTGVSGVRASHNRIVIPRVHDCIALFLGSREAHETHAAQEAGTYYLTKGWLELEQHGPLTEYDRLVKKFGAERGPEIARMAFAYYTRLALINTGNYDIERYRNLAQRTAMLYELRFEELPGSQALVQALAAGDWDDRFLVFEPGEMVSMSAFL